MLETGSQRLTWSFKGCRFRILFIIDSSSEFMIHRRHVNDVFSRELENNQPFL